MKMNCFSALRSVILLALILFASSAFAQTDERPGVEGRKAAIADISAGLDSGSLDLVNARDQLRLLRSEARLAGERLGQSRQLLQQQLATLGPAPENGEVEAFEIAERRTAFLTESADLGALIAQTRLNVDEANRILAGLSERQRTAFYDEVMRPGKSALRPSLWSEARQSAGAIATSASTHISAWRTARKTTGTFSRDLLKLTGVFAFAVLLFWPLRRWINGSLSRTLTKRKPGEFDRYIALAARIMTRLIPGIIGGFALITILDSVGFLTPGGKTLAFTIWKVVLLVLAADGMALGLFAPREPEWRIVPLSDGSARRARWLSVVAVLIVVLGHVFSSIAFLEPEGRGLIGSVIVAKGLLIIGVIWASSRRSTWQPMPDHEEAIRPAAERRWVHLRGLGFPTILIILATLLLGYLNLAAFVSDRAVWLVGLILWIWIGRKTIMSGLRAFDVSFMEKRLEPDAPGRKAMLFWAGLFVDACILIAAFPMAALLLGVDAYSVRAGFVDAFTGITIGNFTLSLADILAAIVTFFVILLVTRFLQRALDARLFAGTRADEGFRNSFRTLLGYAGLIVAIFAAIGVVGLDLSNLAIIAGALSVGIGFGLQSIVNNFVSGLILLFERPVKVGDWVVTTSGEGFIKKISVRSTEIETFDKASVIVPNSELISNSVKNWTHKDRGGRVIVPVGVAYGSDMKKVREILEQIARDHDQILKSPEPFVYFKEFGESSLDIELRFFIRNIPDTPKIRNDVRFAILEAFREHRIEIPYPQRDVHIKTQG